MQLQFPERLQYVAEGKKTMRLLVGAVPDGVRLPLS